MPLVSVPHIPDALTATLKTLVFVFEIQNLTSTPGSTQSELQRSLSFSIGAHAHHMHRLTRRDLLRVEHLPGNVVLVTFARVTWAPTGHLLSLPSDFPLCKRAAVCHLFTCSWTSAGSSMGLLGEK